MRCGRCGNENVAVNRFCGMCGTRLLADAAPSPGVPERATGITAAVSGATSDTGTKAESSPEKSYPEPVVTGPSFLGLNQTSVDRGHANDQRSPQNLDYLLEDEEEEPKRGWSKILLVVLVLALVGGFGYWRSKQGGFAWRKGGPKSGAEAPQSATGGADSGGAASSTNPPVADTGKAQSATPGGTQNPGTPPATEAQGAAPQTAQNAAAPDSGSPSVPTAGAAPQNTVTAARPDDTAPPDAASQPADTAPEKPAAVAAKPSRAKAEARKPASAKPAPAKPLDQVSEAERYIFGRGVKQDCDRGMHMLKQAAQESNVKAMISLGARYSTGTCAARDLPTSYRWFALALHKDPDNSALQDDLQKLWTQMTQPERQLAIKLSQ